MIAVDTNILVYAHRRESARHDAAARALRLLAGGREGWAIPWPCLHEFLAVVTNPRAMRPPTPMAAALRQVEFWLASPTLVVLQETPGHWDALRSILPESGVVGGAVHDARIAALCREHGVRELWTVDRDFSLFRGLAVFDPLVDDGNVHDEDPAWGAVRRARAAGRRRARHESSAGAA